MVPSLPTVLSFEKFLLTSVSHQMVDLKEQIEHEVQSAREEYMKMESHIKLYITEMEQSI